MNTAELTIKATAELYDTCRDIARSVPEYADCIAPLNDASDDDGNPNPKFFQVLLRMAKHRRIEELVAQFANS